ncbi:MAG: polysaccharide deacetylase family protein [Bacillaceae bacterium]
MRVERKKKKRLRRWVKYAIVLLAVIGVGFVGYTSFTAVRAQESEKLAPPVMLAGVSLIKETKKAPKKYNGKTQKIVYVTFDDGPSAHTSDLVRVLDEEKIKATFFLIGTNIPGHEQNVKEIEKKGHYVGMHSMTHDYNKLYTEQQIVDELRQEQTIISNITGKKPTLFRSPYGSMPGLNAQIRQEATAAGLKTWDWTVDSLDWKYQQNPSKIIDEINSQLVDDIEIILLHDKPGTIEVLPQIIKLIRGKGYQFEVYEEKNHFPVNFWKDPSL